MSQCAKILEALQARVGQWVSLPDLAEAANCYAVSERVSELRRKHGHAIENRIEVAKDGAKLSFYRITPAQTQERKCGGWMPAKEPSPINKLNPSAPGELFQTNQPTNAGTY